MHKREEKSEKASQAFSVHNERENRHKFSMLTEGRGKHSAGSMKGTMPGIYTVGALGRLNVLVSLFICFSSVVCITISGILLLGSRNYGPDSAKLFSPC